MTTPARRQCVREGCDQWQAVVGHLCDEHRAQTPPRAYRRWDGGPTRTCPRCEQARPIGDFTLPSGRIQGHCKPCRLAVTAEWRDRHHDAILAKRRFNYPAPISHRNDLQRRRWSLTP
jgi:hypothetical protein